MESLDKIDHCGHLDVDEGPVLIRILGKEVAKILTTCTGSGKPSVTSFSGAVTNILIV